MQERHTLTVEAARIATSFADHFYRRGRTREAEIVVHSAMEVLERVIGTDHPDTLSSMDCAAQLHIDQGRYAEAEPILKRAFQCRDRLLGATHLDTLRSLDHLALMYTEQRGPER